MVHNLFSVNVYTWMSVTDSCEHLCTSGPRGLNVQLDIFIIYHVHILCVDNSSNLNEWLLKHFLSSLPHRFCLTADAAAGGYNGCVSRWLPGTQHGVSGYTDPSGGGDQHERPAAHSHDSSVRSVRVTATQLRLIFVMCTLAICDPNP